ncbi:hypothetical protein Hdeb2414_s0007g00231501 [Helianthus debilis subsp. tardiflorus]
MSNSMSSSLTGFSSALSAVTVCFDDGDNSVEIISYGAMFSPYKPKLQRQFSEEDRKYENQRKDLRDSLNGNGSRI